MKRYGNLFPKITDIDNLSLAYRKAQKGKRWQRAVKDFEKNAEHNLLSIQDTLRRKTFHTSAYKTKTIYEPKKRQIYILPFSPDRIVQHALMNVIDPIWESFFIYDSYACRVGKGIHAGSRRTMEFVRRNDYCLQADISKFYPSISQNILFDIVKRKIKCSDALELIEDIIYSIPGGYNAPIGNYTSQWFGNLYMNELDQYIKHEHKLKDYIRYSDDFLLFHDDKRYLNRLSVLIVQFLNEKLRLALSKSSVFPVSQGVDFLGYRHFKYYILLRKSTAKRVKRRLKKLPIMLETGRINLNQYRSSLASTMGWLRWANTHNLSLKMQVEELMGTCDALQKV